MSADYILYFTSPYRKIYSLKYSDAIGIKYYAINIANYKYVRIYKTFFHKVIISILCKLYCKV